MMNVLLYVGLGVFNAGIWLHNLALMLRLA